MITPTCHQFLLRARTPIGVLGRYPTWKKRAHRSMSVRPMHFVFQSQPMFGALAAPAQRDVVQQVSAFFNISVGVQTSIAQQFARLTNANQTIINRRAIHRAARVVENISRIYRTAVSNDYTQRRSFSQHAEHHAAVHNHHKTLINRVSPVVAPAIKRPNVHHRNTPRTMPAQSEKNTAAASLQTIFRRPRSDDRAIKRSHARPSPVPISQWSRIARRFMRGELVTRERRRSTSTMSIVDARDTQRTIRNRFEMRREFILTRNRIQTVNQSRQTHTRYREVTRRVEKHVQPVEVFYPVRQQMPAVSQVPAHAAPPATVPAAIDVRSIGDDVMRRLNKEMYIERERRGLL